MPLKRNYYLVKALDSFGRRPSGIFTQNQYWLGEYTQCIKIKEEKWYGKHCYILTGNVSMYDIVPYSLGVWNEIIALF